MTDWRYATDLWEYQLHPLTAGQLHLGTPEYANVPVLIAIYDGEGAESLYAPAEIGYVGTGERPDAVLITAIARVSE
jgi:hypothetical protein